MKWAHLPVAGGLYDQHPQLLEEFAYIFSVRAAYQEKKRKAEEQRSRSGSRSRRRGR